MFRHKIFEILNSLTPEEFERLGDFINSPYFCKNKNAAAVYEYLFRHFPDFDTKEISKKSLYTFIYKVPGYNDSSIRSILSKFVKLLEVFLAAENIRQKDLTIANLLLEELNKRKLSALFIKNLKDTEKSIKTNKSIDFDMVLNRYVLERNKYNFSMYHDRIINKNKVYPHIRILSEAGVFLTIYYITELIAENVNIIVYSEKFNVEEKVPETLELILESIDYIKIFSNISGNYEFDFLLEIYISLLNAFRSIDTDEEYFHYNSLVEKYSCCLSSDERSFHYSIMLGLCILKRRISSDSAVFVRELGRLYDEMLRNEYYRNKKEIYMPVDLYRDILFYRIETGNTFGVIELIEDHTCKLHLSLRENMKNFSLAYYCYEQMNFKGSLEYINKIKLDYFIYKYDIKNLMLKTYYELGYLEETLSLIHSYRELLRKDTFLTEKRKIRIRSFLFIMRKIVINRIDDNLTELENTKIELLVTDKVRDKKWLLLKLDEILYKRLVYK